MAHYYRDRRDARAVEWYEAALAHSLEEGPDAGQTPQWFSIRVFYLIEPLAGYSTGLTKNARPAFSKAWKKPSSATRKRKKTRLPKPLWRMRRISNAIYWLGYSHLKHEP